MSTIQVAQTQPTQTFPAGASPTLISDTETPVPTHVQFSMGGVPMPPLDTPRWLAPLLGPQITMRGYSGRETMGSTTVNNNTTVTCTEILGSTDTTVYCQWENGDTSLATGSRMFEGAANVLVNFVSVNHTGNTPPEIELTLKSARKIKLPLTLTPPTLQSPKKHITPLPPQANASMGGIVGIRVTRNDAAVIEPIFPPASTPEDCTLNGTLRLTKTKDSDPVSSAQLVPENCTTKDAPSLTCRKNETALVCDWKKGDETISSGTLSLRPTASVIKINVTQDIATLHTPTVRAIVSTPSATPHTNDDVSPHSLFLRPLKGSAN